MSKVTVFIDESGTLPDPKDQVVIVAAVSTSIPKSLLKPSKSARKYLKNAKKRLSEIKFYRAGLRTKKRFLKELASQDISIFTLIVEKHRQKIEDSPDNFAILCWLLLEECLIFYKNQIKEVVFDRHFHRLQDQVRFNRILAKLLGKKLPFKHVDSQQDPRVNTADMVAGSVLHFSTGKNKSFYKIIRKKVISEKRINWKEAKRKFLNKKLA